VPLHNGSSSRSLLTTIFPLNVVRTASLQSAGSQERAGGPGANRGASCRPREAKLDKEAHGEFESECPGYCVYVGTLKGVGRVYQQTAIDTYAKVAFAKLYDRKTPLTAADLMNDRVVPFFARLGLARYKRLPIVTASGKR
jgi:hypothetical protein